jgi:hypothetical protein
MKISATSKTGGMADPFDRLRTDPVAFNGHEFAFGVVLFLAVNAVPNLAYSGMQLLRQVKFQIET